MVDTSNLRPQYHFRPGPEGLRAWDVRKLVKMSASRPVEHIALSDIREIDEPYWYGTGEVATVRSVATHARLIQDADTTFPIILCADRRVMDGMHRVARALLDGQDTIAAIRLDPTPPPDFVGVDPQDLPYD